MARNLETGWEIIATSGATVDGRNIEKKWLEDMANHYNESLYSAKIWPDHERYAGAWGKVADLKVEPATEPELKGEIHLKAKLCPSDDLVYLNRRGKYTHTSIEVKKNFRGKGYFYLGGLAVTDEPASAGTTELHFKDTAEVLRFPGQSIRFSESDEHDDCQTDERKFFQKLKDFFNKDNGESQDTAMDKEQFNQLVEGQNKIVTALTAMTEKFTAKPPAKTEDDKSGGGKDKTNDDGKGEFVSKKEYDDLAKKLTDLDAKFTELKNTPIPGTNGLESLGDVEAEI